MRQNHIRGFDDKERVEVELGENELGAKVPKRVLWRGRWRVVSAQIEYWRVDGKWWIPPGVSRLHFKVVIEGDVPMHLVYQGGVWVVWGIED